MAANDGGASDEFAAIETEAVRRGDTSPAAAMDLAESYRRWIEKFGRGAKPYMTRLHAIRRPEDPTRLVSVLLYAKDVYELAKVVRDDLAAGRQPSDDHLPRVPKLPFDVPDVRLGSDFAVLQKFLTTYRAAIAERHPAHAHAWPFHSSSACTVYTYDDCFIYVLAESAMNAMTGGGALSEDALGCDRITEANVETVRRKLEDRHRVGERGAVLILRAHGASKPSLTSEIDAMLVRHERTMGVRPMHIFLSHKGDDKPLVRDFKDTLVLLGFDVWLDEDALVLGDELDRSIRRAMMTAAAAIFFVTGAFKDEKFIADEVNYAKARMRDEPTFKVLTLVFGDNEANVPDLLRPYLYRAPTSDLAKLREVLKALPLVVGPVRPR